MKKTAKFVVAENIKRLAKMRGENTTTLGDKSKTSQATVSRLVKPQNDKIDPRLTTIEQTGEALKTSLWKLFFDDMPIELFADKSLDLAIRQLAECSPDNRLEIYRQIERIAKQDALEKKVKELEARE